MLLPVTSSAEKGDERQGDAPPVASPHLTLAVHSPHEYILSAFCLRDLGHVSGQSKDPGPQGAYVLLGAVKPLSSLRQGWGLRQCVLSLGLGARERLE